MKNLRYLGLFLIATVSAAACGDKEENEGGSPADQAGIAASCTVTADCSTTTIGEGEEAETVQLQCLTEFADGYCAIKECDSNVDCPAGASCVAHDDGQNYCFKQCAEKTECNVNREGAEDANCSANFDYADSEDEDTGLKACIPPSSGTGVGGAGGASADKKK